MASNDKSLTTKVVDLDNTFDLDLWKANADKGARSYGPRNPCYAVSPKSEQMIFISKESNKYESWSKFRAIQPGYRICIIWCPDVGDMVPASKVCESGKSGRG
jgi:hypothetical protein